MEIRPLRDWDEYRACEALQRAIWGEDFRDVVPGAMLKIAREVGGVASGAFHPDDGLVGFVFGLTGVRDGEPSHWSHMLAVRPDHRGRGLGRRLKEHQRELARDLGIREMRWTFDPLVAGNAHLNLNRLGVRVEAYVPQMYGSTGSRLHESLGTDRFVVVWDLDDYDPGDAGPGRSTARSPARDAEGGTAPDGLPATGEPDGPTFPGTGEDAADLPPVLRVEVPSDVHAVRDEDPEEAARWRERTREAFLSGLEAGYRVTGFVPGPDRGFYVLVHGKVEAAAAEGGDGDAPGPTPGGGEGSGPGAGPGPPGGPGGGPGPSGHGGDGPAGGRP